jgi:SAM-dependent methyltransferase
MDLVDHYAGIRENRREPYAREAMALSRIEAHLRGGSAADGPARILDAGCGDGTFLGFLETRLAAASLSGVDFSQDRLESRDPARATLRQADLNLGLPYEDGAFDIVYSGEVLEHLLDPDTFLRHVRRVLQEGGLFVLSTPNLFAWYNRALMLCGIQPLFVEMSNVSGSIGVGPLKRFKLQERPVGHIRIFHPQALRDLLELHGFRVLTIEGTSFERFPGLLRRVDSLVAKVPSLASDLLVCAT